MAQEFVPIFQHYCSKFTCAMIVKIDFSSSCKINFLQFFLVIFSAVVLWKIQGVMKLVLTQHPESGLEYMIKCNLKVKVKLGFSAPSSAIPEIEKTCTYFL